MGQRQPQMFGVPEGFEFVRGLKERVLHVQPKTDMMWIRDRPQDEDGLVSLGIQILGPSELIWTPQGLPHTGTKFFIRTAADLLCKKEHLTEHLMRMRFDGRCH